MTRDLLQSDCLSRLRPELLSHNLMGLERESLRVTHDGRVAGSAHPAAIGDKLTHPQITVDFSEGLLELVSAPHDTLAALRQQMQDLHGFVARHLLPDEMFWAMSMPPGAREDEIRIADFGRSASGRMKQVYRQGLAARYGKIMQIIAGVHFNFSFDPRFVAEMHRAFGAELSAQDCRNRLYFRLIRGFDQHAWLLPYLFGASPIAARSSVKGDVPWLKPLDAEHVFGEYATSLRMSDIGYQSPAQSDLFVSHASLDKYVRELVLATRTPWPDYQRLGVRRGEDWVQLNGNILQIENEYYSAIRPKQVAQRGERPACALQARGVSYIEVRMLDVDPFESLGISAQTADFMQVYLLVCLAWGERDDGRQQQDRHNRSLAIRYGRDRALQLMRGHRPQRLRDWADECLDDCAIVAQTLDAAQGGGRFAAAVAAQRDKLQAPENLPSQQVLDQGQALGYHDWACRLSQQHTRSLAELELAPQTLQQLTASVSASLADSAALAVPSEVEFAAYVEDYFASLCDDKLAVLLES